jgi:hypothetical protein
MTFQSPKLRQLLNLKVYPCSNVKQTVIRGSECIAPSWILANCPSFAAERRMQHSSMRHGAESPAWPAIGDCRNVNQLYGRLKTKRILLDGVKKSSRRTAYNYDTLHYVTLRCTAMRSDFRFNFFFLFYFKLQLPHEHNKRWS